MRIGATISFIVLLAAGPGCVQAPTAPADDTAAIAAAGGRGTAGGDRRAQVLFEIEGQVQSVEDGDTIRIQTAAGVRSTIRFSDIDTPETSHGAYTPVNCNQCDPTPLRPGQPGGQRARNSLLEFISIGDQVRAECYEKDPYERSVCHVFRGAINLNLEQVRRGWGWLPDNDLWVRDPESRTAEQTARAARLGAWGLAGQVTPAEWRRACWREGHCPDAER